MCDFLFGFPRVSAKLCPLKFPVTNVELVYQCYELLLMVADLFHATFSSHFDDISVKFNFKATDSLERKIDDKFVLFVRIEYISWR